MIKATLAFACAAVFATSVAATSVAVAQSKPLAPSNICINTGGSNSCTSAASGSGTIKWNPGHYAMSDTRPTTPGYQDFIHSEIDEMAAVTNSSGKPAMKGFEVNYTWYWLETSRGTYDTTLIDQNIEHLKALSTKYGTTFRLIIQINDASPGMVSFQSASQAAPYTSASNTYRGTLPTYIWNGVSGSGSGDVFTDLYSSSTQTYYHPALWRAAVMDRFIALLTYLGNKYDSNPYVEAIIPVGETSWALVSPPSDLTSTNWSTQMKRLVDAVASAWPTTNKILNINFQPTNVSESTLLNLAQYAAGKQVGFGGPDILYGAYDEAYGALISRGAGGQWGSTDYRGTLPLAWQEQADYGNWTQETSPGIESYAYDSLGATHVIWGNHHDYGANSTQNWSGVVSTLQGVGFRIRGTCPTYYKAGCKSN